MEYEASKFLKRLYCLIMAVKVIPIVFRNSRSTFESAVNGAIFDYNSLFTLLIAIALLYRIFVVIKVPDKLNAFVSSKTELIMRDLGILFMLCGLVASILLIIADLLISASNLVSSWTIQYPLAMHYIRLPIALVSVCATFISAAGWPGIAFFELSRNLGPDAKQRERIKMRQVDVAKTKPSVNSGRNEVQRTPFSSIAVATCLIGLGFYVFSPFVIWDEEVKLNDGRVIVVEQKKFVEDGINREAWLTISLPEFSELPIVWHEHLSPMVLNIDGGMLYVVGQPPTAREGRQYGCPKPPYVGFAWDGSKWNRIPFEKIPKAIYAANLLVDGFPPRGTYLLKLGIKEGADLNGRGTLPQFLKQINPALGNFGCVL